MDESTQNTAENVTLKSVIDFTGGTEGTGGTAHSGAASSGSPEKNTEGTGGTAFNPDEAIDPLREPDENRIKIKKLSFDDLKLPCYIVLDDWFDLGGKRKPGVWYCYETPGTKKKPPTQIALRICSPLYIDDVTDTEDGRFYGRLLRFRDTLGHWHTWAMPMELLRGSCEELRGEILAAGVEIEQRNRLRLAEYLQWRTPKAVITAATRTGWTAKGGAFVLHDRIIGGENIHFQSESLSADGAAKTGGDLQPMATNGGIVRRQPGFSFIRVCSTSGAVIGQGAS